MAAADAVDATTAVETAMDAVADVVAMARVAITIAEAAWAVETAMAAALLWVVTTALMAKIAAEGEEAHAKADLLMTVRRPSTTEAVVTTLAATETGAVRPRTGLRTVVSTPVDRARGSADLAVVPAVLATMAVSDATIAAPTTVVETTTTMVASVVEAAVEAVVADLWLPLVVCHPDSSELLGIDCQFKQKSFYCDEDEPKLLNVANWLQSFT